MSFYHTKRFWYCLFGFFLIPKKYLNDVIPSFWLKKNKIKRRRRRILNANKNSISQFDLRLWLFLSFRYFNSFHCSQILILFSSSIIIRMLFIHCHCFMFNMCIAIESHKGPFTSLFFYISFVTRASLTKREIEKWYFIPSKIEWNLPTVIQQFQWFFFCLV